MWATVFCDFNYRFSLLKKLSSSDWTYLLELLGNAEMKKALSSRLGFSNLSPGICIKLGRKLSIIYYLSENLKAFQAGGKAQSPSF